MSCLGQYYLPLPPRVWSRVQNVCAYSNSEAFLNTPGDFIYLPYSNEPILKSEYNYQLACLKKGNVLQYKKNSSNLTKKQVYGQIAKQMWVNSNTTWATQSDKFTDPNTKSLKRVNYFNITTSGVPTPDPLTCSLPVPAPKLNNSLPTRSNSSNSNAPVIPPQPSSGGGGGPVIPPVPSQQPTAPIVIADGGNLVCNVVENICTGEIIAVTANNSCFLTTASDVPGTPILLCYNDSLPTVYAKTRLTYPNAGGKWPVGAKFIAAANTTKPIPSALSTESVVKPIGFENNYNIYTINSETTDDFLIGNPGIYIIQEFNGTNIILPEDTDNLSFYTFFNMSGNNVNISSPNEMTYFFNEFYSSSNGINNLTINPFQSLTITSVISNGGKTVSYYSDYNMILTGKQNSNIAPLVTYINNNTDSNPYIVSEKLSDFYIIQNYSSSQTIVLPDQSPNFTIIKFINLYTSSVVVSSSNLIHNTYYQPLGSITYTLYPYEYYSFQLIKSATQDTWIMNSNNIQLNQILPNIPYYISNINGDFNVNYNSVYIIESITGNIILPNNPPNLSNIKLFNTSKNPVYITTPTSNTLLCNSFFAPMFMNGITSYRLSANSAICFEYLNIENTPAQLKLYGETEMIPSNNPFWIFTIS